METTTTDSQIVQSTAAATAPATQRKPRLTNGRQYADDKSQFSVTILAPVEEVYSFYRNFENLPTFMKDLKEIKILSPTKQHWVAETKGGYRAEWDAEITAERPNEMIAWRSLEGSDIKTSGAIFFAPATGNRGTVVSLTYDFHIPGGPLAEVVSFFTGDHPSELAFVNLRRLKARIETGEVPTTEGQSSGREETAEKITTH